LCAKSRLFSQQTSTADWLDTDGDFLKSNQTGRTTLSALKCDAECTLGGETTKCKVPPQQLQLDPVEKWVAKQTGQLHLYIIILYSYNLGCPPSQQWQMKFFCLRSLTKSISKHNHHGGDCYLAGGHRKS